MPHARLVLLLLVPAAAAQATHLVGPGGFPQIRDALAVAAPGDVINVQAGTYAQFDVTVGVTIRALVPGTVNIAFDWAFAPPGCATTPTCPPTQGATRFLILTGQSAHVVGLRFVATTPTIGPNIFPRVEVFGNRVTFDQCEFRSSAFKALYISQAAVHLQDCTVTGLNLNPATNGVYAVDGVVTVVGGSFAAPLAALYAPGGDGIRLDNCVFQGSGFQASGSTAQWGLHGAAVRAIGGETWISDALLQGGGNTCGLVASGVLRASRITWASACPAMNDAVLGVLRPSPLQVGTTFTLDFRTDANGFAAVFADTQLAWNSIGLTTPEPFLALANVLTAGLYLAGPSGSALASWPIPTNPSLVSQPFWFQGVTGLSLPLLTSPVAGGIVR
ncbi:MAG TPA: hypothetical protein VF384_12315 [Planctomycetota bacterium]